MKNTKYFLSTLLLAGVLAACSSSWDQDPLAKKNNVLKEGQQKPTAPEKPNAESSETIRLDSPSFYSFREGVEGEFVMVGRVLKTGYVPRIIIENLGDFPGARFDATTGKFVWTPALGTVSSSVGDTRETKILKVLVLGEKAGEGPLRNSFDLRLEVGKVLNAPEIFSVSNNNMSVREGEVTNISLQIRDKDAGSDPSTWPSVQALPLLGYSNISQFVTVTNMQSVGNNQYNMTLKVDLTGAELTKSKGNYGFALQAVSRFQQQSIKQNIYVNVLTSLATMQSTWFDVLDFSLGVKDEHQFLIYDPKDEALLGTPVFTGTPAGASFSCSGVGVSKQLCKMTWAPDFMSTPGDFTVKASVLLKNQDPTDMQTKTQYFDLRMRVNSAPPVRISNAGGN